MPDVRFEYSRYRLERAKESLTVAQELAQNGHYRDANNRAYYGVFHALRAVLALNGFDAKKHSGIIAEFRRLYIKTGVFPEEISDIIGNAFIIRNASDYDDMFIATRTDTEIQIANANRLISTIGDWLETQYKKVSHQSSILL